MDSIFMLINRGDLVRTDFLKGKVSEVIDGRSRGWDKCPYFKVVVTYPACAAGTVQIVKLSEIRDYSS